MSERSGARAEDPLSGRQPTSHERRAGQPWDASYHDGPAPWDVGHPQPAIVRVAVEGGFAGTVLDVGCGTGDNALHVASLGLLVLGVDGNGWNIVVIEADRVQTRYHGDNGAPAWFAIIKRIQLARLAGPVSDLGGLKQS